MSLLFRAISIPMVAASAVASRFRTTPTIRADQVPAPEVPEEPAEGDSVPVLRIRLPGLPMSWVQDGELPLLRKSVRIFRSAQAMLDPKNRRIAYEIVTCRKLGRTQPTARERLDAIRLMLKKAGR